MIRRGAAPRSFFFSNLGRLSPLISHRHHHHHPHSRRKRPLTAAEQAEVADARARAAAAAEGRQAKYAQTAVGKATAKAVADARKPAAPPGRSDTRAADWLS